MATGKRTKATAIPFSVKKEVYERDKKCCIFCGKPVDIHFANVHLIPRSAGGLGIKENIVTGCFTCHNKMDASVNRLKMMHVAKMHLKYHYPNLDEIEVKFTKGWERE